MSSWRRANVSAMAPWPSGPGIASTGPGETSRFWVDGGLRFLTAAAARRRAQPKRLYGRREAGWTILRTSRRPAGRACPTKPKTPEETEDGRQRRECRPREAAQGRAGVLLRGLGLDALGGAVPLAGRTRRFPPLPARPRRHHPRHRQHLRLPRPLYGRGIPRQGDRQGRPRQVRDRHQVRHPARLAAPPGQPHPPLRLHRDRDPPLDRALAREARHRLRRPDPPAPARTT